MKIGERNEGAIDRIFRLVSGAAFLAGGYLYLQAPVSYAAMAIGLILVVTGITGSCALYSLAGISTIGKKCCDFPAKKL